MCTILGYARDCSNVVPLFLKPATDDIIAGIYLTDLVFQEELPDRTEDGLINFVKNRKVAGVIQQIAEFQDQCYPFTPVPELRELFLNYEEKDEEAVMQMSYRAEPKGQ